MKTCIFTLLAIISIHPLFAKADEIGGSSRFGEGDDSIRCLRNISLYAGYVKKNDFKSAYLPWKAVFTETPCAEASIYSDGARILRALIAESQDEAKEQAYLEDLMEVHDQHIRYLNELNTLASTSLTKGAVRGMQMHDYILFSGEDMDVEKAYNWGKEALEEEMQKADYYVFQDMMGLSLRKLNADSCHVEQFIQDYLTISGHVEEALKESAEPRKQQLLTMAKNNVDSYFIHSGVATCENLQAIYAPKIKEHLSDITYLRQTAAILRALRCTCESAYCTALEAMNALEPEAKTIAECGLLYAKKGDTGKSILCFDQAVMLSTTNEEKAAYNYQTAEILFNDKQLDLAKEYVLKSIALNRHNGKAYILLAQMYASSPNWSQEDTLNRCTYFAVLDKLQQALSMDPGITREANKLIDTYTTHTPNEKDLSFVGLKKGDSLIIGGWINETTTIR